MEENKEKNVLHKTTEEVEKIIDSILEQGIQQENLEILYKLVDIHKDIANEEYWQKKKEEIEMRYRGYSNDYGEYNDGSYGRRGVSGTGRERYSDGSYGRRGVKGTGRGRYRGEEMLDEMMYEYGNYADGKDMYGNDQDTMQSFKKMLKAFKDYYKHLKQEASSQEEVEMLEDVAREMIDM